MLPRNLNDSVMVMISLETCMMVLGDGAVPEIYNELFCYRCVELEVVIKAPSGCLVYLLSVSVFFVVTEPG